MKHEFFFNSIEQDNYGIQHPRVFFYAYFSPNLTFSSEMQYDSAIKYKLDYPGTPKFAEATQETTNGKVTKLKTGLHNYTVNSWHSYWTSTFNYAGNLIISQSDSGKHTPGIVQKNYYYNSTGALDSVITTGSQQKIIYSYNNGILAERINNISNGDTCKTIYSYQSNGLLTGQIMMYYKSTIAIWDTMGGIDFLYNSANQLIHEKRWGDSGKTFLTIDILYDNNNNRIEDIIHCDYYQNGQNTGLIKAIKKQYGYNSFGLISDFEVVHWNDSSKTWELGADSLFGTSQRVELEYDVFWPQDIKTINEDKTGLTIFPSPASGFITVKAEDMPGGILEGTVCDMQGRILRKWTDKSDEIYTVTIPVQELPAGNYILQLRSGNMSRHEKFVIYR